MTEEEFWSLVDILGGAANHHTAPHLTRALTGESRARIEAFSDLLAEKLQLLEDAHLAGIPVSDAHDPPGAAPVPLAGDALDNLHLAIVAAGRSRFLRVLTHPHEAADRIWDFAESDELAEAVSSAYENTTGEPWQGPLPGFHAVEPDAAADAAAGNPPWLSIALHGESEIPTAYFDAATSVAETIQNDPRWRAWWSQAEPQDLTIEVELGLRAERNNFTTRKARLWASFRRDSSRFRGSNKNTLAHLAATDLQSFLTLTATFLNLPAHPPVPLPPHTTPPTSRRDAARTRLEELRRRHGKNTYNDY
ncbi:DUF4240 domain-containing protein [Streptomyces wedmorensis]|uniref:DUF4240 domain-containing protein n=1 Tax=Streptomyces wedmorensis TaxID=43759 RepID=A0ABW6J0I2_STRWE